jgi:hypothetical protein
MRELESLENLCLLLGPLELVPYIKSQLDKGRTSLNLFLKRSAFLFGTPMRIDIINLKLECLVQDWLNGSHGLFEAALGSLVLVV